MTGQVRRDSVTNDNLTDADERPRRSAATGKGRSAASATATPAA